MPVQQQTFDFGPVNTQQPAAVPEQRKVVAVTAKALKAVSQRRTAQATLPGLPTLAALLDAEEMAGPEPAEIRMPQPGDIVEMLWAEDWPKTGWVQGRIVEWADPRHGLVVRLTDSRFKPHTIWGAWLYHRDEALNRRINGAAGPIWRWPKEG